MAADSLLAPLLVSLREAARLLSVSERTAWQLVHDGELPAVQLGRGRLRRKLLIDVDDLRALIAKRKTPTART